MRPLNVKSLAQVVKKYRLRLLASLGLTAALTAFLTSRTYSITVRVATRVGNSSETGPIARSVTTTAAIDSWIQTVTALAFAGSLAIGLMAVASPTRAAKPQMISAAGFVVAITLIATLVGSPIATLTKAQDESAAGWEVRAQSFQIGPAGTMTGIIGGGMPVVFLLVLAALIFAALSAAGGILTTPSRPPERN